MSLKLLFLNIKSFKLPFEINEKYEETYKKFLCLKVFTNDIDGLYISPSYELDKIWHRHLLYNKNYLDMCIKLGQIIYHFPERALDSQAVINTRIGNMIELYTQYFGESEESNILYDKIDIKLNITDNLKLYTKDEINIIANNLTINITSKNKFSIIYNFIKEKFLIDQIEIYYEGKKMNLDTEISELDLIFNPNIDIILISKQSNLNENKDSYIININDEDSGDENIESNMDLYENPIQVFVNTLSGKTITLEIYSDYTIKDIQRLIKKKEGIPKSHQKLSCNAQILDPIKTINYYGIHNLSTIHLMVNLRGC
jgi:hypothetical protein